MILAVLLLPICLKKELAELAWVSYVLFISLALFTVVNFIMLAFDSHFDPEGLNVDVLKPKIEWETISSLSVTMLAYSYQQNVFPIFSELRNKTNAEYQAVSLRGLPLTACIYFLVGTICALSFGKTLESSVLLNIGEIRHKDDPSKAFWEAYICQIAFMIVLFCHIPFIFFSGKEAMLIVIDEIIRKSISNALWHKLQGNNHFSMAPENQNAPNPDLPCPGDDNQMTFNSLVIRSSQAGVEQGEALKQSRMRSKAIMSHVSAAVAQRMAYKEMSDAIYYTSTIILYIVIAFTATQLGDITAIIDMISAYAISCMAFFVPAVFYRKGVKKFGIEIDKTVKNRLCVTLIFIPIGCLNAILGFLAAILYITGVTAE